MASDKETKQNEYWRAREEEALRQRITDEAEYQRRIDQIYADMLESCQSEIDRFYRKYAEEESISLAEAKKRVSRLDIEAYERKAERYVKEKNFSKEANAEMRLYNATMKINRLEMLKANIGLELISGHDELEKFMEKILQGRTEDELKRQAGILGDTIRDNAKAAHSIVNASFHNATFSDRIWMYQDLLKADLAKLLQSGMIQGKNPRVLARELESKFGASRYNAERLMRTELARVQTDAQKLSFEKMGFEEYTFHANSNCCDACQALNGKHFKIKDMMPGENAAPLHPGCRCSCSAYEDSDEYEAWLDFLANGGTTEQWKMRNDKAYQAQIKARREAYKKRMEQNGSIKGIDSCKTTQDVEKLMKGKGWFNVSRLENGKIFDTNKMISLAGVDLECAKSIYKSYDKLFSKYPKMIGKLSSVNSDVLKVGTIAQCNVGFGLGPITVNKRYYRDANTLRYFHQDAVNNAFAPAGTTWHSYMMHEIGHAVDDYFTNTLQLAGMKNSKIPKDVSSAMRPKVMRACNMKISDIGTEVSGYATKNHHEWFAECFAEYMDSENPRAVATEFGKQLEELMKKVE